MNEEIKNILEDLQYNVIFTKLKNLPSTISNIKNQRDIKKNEKQNLIEELNHRENELLENVFVDALGWKEKKKPNNEESRKNHLELLKHNDSTYQTIKTRLSATELELSKLNIACEEAENTLKTYIALKDLINSKINLIISFREREKKIGGENG